MAVDLKALWVGDLVWIRSLQHRGAFRGCHSESLAKVQVGDTIIRVDAGDLELIQESVNLEEDHFLLELQQDIPRNHPEWLDFTRSLDLHLEALDADLKHASPSRALSYQLSKARDYLQRAVRMQVPSVVIIHGKGTGVLKLELEHLLGEFQAVRHHHAVNDGGAMEIWFAYNKG